MTFHAPVREIERALASPAGAGLLWETERFGAVGADERAAILDAAARLAEDVFAPVNSAGDANPARLENGLVRTAPGFAQAYAAFAEGGWCGVTADPEHGGMGLPQSIWCAVYEMIAGANLSLSLCPLLSAGAVEALERHASDPMRRLYLPKLVAGAWTGTMNLTEPQAGSDVGALRTRARPNGDGSYALTGEKIYITWGDHDCAENIVHLVLARIEGAPEGASGVSMFLAPKLLPDAEGRPGARNALRAVSLERKLGIHGSPTCAMAYDGASGWLVGAENRGLAAMFTMMNNARLAVAMQGVGIASAALDRALGFAKERRQGRTAAGDGPILGHVDVRRMLGAIAARAACARCVAYACAAAIDLSHAADEEERPRWAARAAFLTPIAKAFCTDVGVEAADLAIQIHGGLGYVEDAGVAQLLRDARIAPIYEGTNGIQAMDLVGRKLADGGAAARELLAEIAAGADAPESSTARAALETATDWMLAASRADREAGAAPYLRAWGLTLGAHLVSRQAADDTALAPLADFVRRREMTAVPGLCAAATDGAATLTALPFEDRA